jgi:hypothetical protein
MAEIIRFPLHRGNIRCSNCKVGITYGSDIINKADIECPNCHSIFSYDDGFIEFLVTTVIDVLFFVPICAGVLESGDLRTKVGKATRVQFKTPFYELYGVDIARPEETDEKLFEQIIFTPAEVTSEGFVVTSSSSNESIINQEIEIAYSAKGRDFLENVPIWHRFLQSTINSIKAQQYGMAMVESVTTFDAYFDEFLMTQLKRKRGYSSKSVRQIVETRDRRDKLYYLLFYVSGKTFEDSPYDKDLKDIVDMRNKIVHPKEYKFSESVLTKDNAMKALETVIKSIKWVNDTKRKP